MSTRSKYLARVLMDRSRSLAASREDGEEQAGLKGVRDLVAKVLVVEEGITDESKVRLVVDALPAVSATRPQSDRDLQELADFLQERLWK